MANKTVLITGSSRGIGAATAEIFAKNGFNVVINYNKSEKEALNLLEKLLHGGAKAVAVRADVSNRDNCEKMFNDMRSNFGNISVLVNNAGHSEQEMFTQITLQKWRKMFEVHVEGTFNCSQLALQDMIPRKSGKIINVSSILGINGASCETHYSAAKAAIIGFTRALAKEVGPSGIQVNCVCPGVILTEMNAELDDSVEQKLLDLTPTGRFGTAEDVGNLIYFLGSESSNFITGQAISVDGGMFNI